MNRPLAPQVASQSVITADALHSTTPVGRAERPQGAFEARPPLTENSPKGCHVPEGETDPSPHVHKVRCWDHIKRMAQQFEQSWVGDLVGAICVFGIGYLALFIGWIFN